MIKFKELLLENFKSWKKLHIRDFDSKGLCLVYGTNGAGKSSLRQAIEYLLLDKTSDILPVSDLVRNNVGDCRLYCKLIKDQDIIEITKYRDHSEFGNKTFLLINGDDSRTFSDRRDTQKEILKVLEIDSDYLFASSIFSNNTSSFIELNDNNKKDILYRVLELEKYQQYYDIANDKCSEIKKDIDKAKAKIETLEDNYAELNIELEKLVTSRDSFEEEKNISLKDIKDKIANSIKQKEMEEIKLDNLENELSDYYYSEVIDAKIKKLSINETRDRLLNDKDFYTKELSKLEFEEKKYKDKLKSVQNSTCPILKESCNRLIEISDEVKKEVDLVLPSISLEKTNCENRLYDINKELKVLDKVVDIHDKVKDEFNEIYERWNDEKHDIRGLENYIDNQKTKYEDTLKSDNVYLKLVDEKEKKINELSDTLDKLESGIAELTSLYDYYKFWKEGFSRKGIPNLKIESYLSTIEEKVNENLHVMKDRTYVKLNSQKQISTGEFREEIDYQIFSPTKNITNYRSYSGGERQRLKIADLFAFSILFNKFNILILDEVLELSLDDLGKEEIVELMKSQAINYGSVFVISHSKAIQDVFDNSIIIEKIDDTSNVKG